MSDLIKNMLEKNLIVKINNPDKRILDEMKALKNLEIEDGYLDVYNAAIRYCFIWLLQHGFDIKGKKVHVVLNSFLIHIGSYHKIRTAGVIKARHLLKYQGLSVNYDCMNSLEKCLGVLKCMTVFKIKVVREG